MKLYKSILIVFLALGAQHCTQTLSHSSSQDNIQSEFVILPTIRDSVPVSGVTKYFYRYVFVDMSRWTITPEWALANLAHFVIIAMEPWNYAGVSSSTF